MPKLVPIHYEKLIKAFELEGFQIARQRGDNIMMTKAGVKRPLVIKTSPREVSVTHTSKPISTLPVFLAKDFLNCWR